jgi:hypothetical protein
VVLSPHLGEMVAAKIVASVREYHYIGRTICVCVRAANGDGVVVVIASDAERTHQPAS